MATNSNNLSNNINDDNTSRYQCFVEMHPSGSRNSRHFQVPATIHPFHGPIVELELFHLWLSDNEDRPMDFFRGPRTRHLVDVYWDPPLGEFIRYHHNEVLYFYYSVITPEEGDTSDPHADRRQDPSDNHSTPSPLPISVASTRSSSSSPISLYAKKIKNTSSSFPPSKRATDRSRSRRHPTSYLWKLVAYSGGLEAHLQNQRQQRQEKLKMVQQQRRAPLAVYMYDHGSSHQQQQSTQRQQHQSTQQPQQYRFPQNHQSQSQPLQQEQQLQPLNRAPILAQSFTHYGRKFSYHHQSHNQGYNQHNPGYYHPSQAQNQQQQCSSYDQGQGQYYNKTHTSNTHGNHGQGHSPVQNYANPVQSNNFHQAYNIQAPTNYLSQTTNYTQTLDQLQRFNYQSPAGDRLVQEHLEECRWKAVKFETYLNDLHLKLGGRTSTVPHPPPTIATVATQGRDIPMADDNRRSQGRGQGIPEIEQEEREDETEKKKEKKGGKAETEQKAEMEKEKEEEKRKQEEREIEEGEAFARRGPQEFLKRKRSINASNEEKEDEDKVEIKQKALSDDDRAALQRKPQESSDTMRSIEDEAEKTEHKAKRSKKNTNNTSRGHICENSPATSVVEPVVKRSRSRFSVSSMTRVSPISGSMRYRR